ncbi:MAG: hypothetical protein ACTSYI_08130, partial [Promethearchaeota archaeon]
ERIRNICEIPIANWWVLIGYPNYCPYEQFLKQFLGFIHRMKTKFSEIIDLSSITGQINGIIYTWWNDEMSGQERELSSSVIEKIKELLQDQFPDSDLEIEIYNQCPENFNEGNISLWNDSEETIEIESDWIIRQAIDFVDENKKCYGCGQSISEEEQFSEIEGDFFCEKCCGTLKTCVYCKELINPDKLMRNENGEYCDDYCLSKALGLR